MNRILETSKGRFADEIEWVSDKQEVNYEQFKTLMNDFNRKV